MDNNQNDSFIDMMENVSKLLKGADEYGLQTEVVTWALMAQKENPKLSIDQAMFLGFSEWIK